MGNSDSYSKTISVVLASYNGEKYIAEQIESIIHQLDITDELIISDDGSTDKTVNIIQDYASKYDNIKFLQGPGKGYIKNFEFLMKKSSNDIVCISDQDDIWNPHKIDIIRKAFIEVPNTWIVLHNMEACDGMGQKIKDMPDCFSFRKTRHGFLKNLFASSYYGCCMCLSREFVELLLPFPNCKYSYDQWIGLSAEICRRSVFISDCLIIHRLHNNNQSKARQFLYRELYRLEVLRASREIVRRYKKGRVQSADYKNSDR